MINWFNIPDEGLSNGGLFEVKELEVTENGTYETKGEMYNKVTVNVEGGGGESDISTAQVTNSGDSEENITLNCVINEIGPNMETPTEGSVGAGRTKTAVLYKGHQYVNLDPAKIVTVSSGNAEIITVADPMFGDTNFLDIKGDCTILVANAE